MTDDHLRRYRSRLDAALDRREDPLADDELLALLDEHPELLDGFATERLLLGQLAAPAAPVRTAARSRWRWLAVAAAAAAAAVVIRWQMAPPAPTADDDYGAPRILAASLSERPRSLHASVPFRVREPLLQTHSTRLEIYEHRTEKR